MRPYAQDFGKAFASILQHAGVIWWLIKDLCRKYYLRMMLTTGLSFLGVSTRLGAAGVALLYVHAREKGTAAKLFGLKFHVNDSLTTLVLWATVVVACAAISAGSIYLAEAINFNTSRRYADGGIRRVIHGIGQLTRGLHGVRSYQESSYARRMLSRDMNMLLRLLIVVTGAVLPILMLCFSSTALFWMNPELTAAVLGVLALYSIPFFMLNRATARASRKQEEHMGEASGLVRRIINATLERSSNVHIRGRFADSYLRNPAARGVMDAYREIILSHKRALLFHEIMFGVTVCLVLLVFGFVIARNESSWSALGFYLMSLKYASSSLNQVTGSIVRMNRFAPQISRFAAFEAAVSVREAKDSNRMGPVQAIELAVSGQPMKDSLLTHRLEPGSRTLCICPEPLTMWSMARHVERLTNGDRRIAKAVAQQAYLCGRLDAFPHFRMRDLLGCDDEHYPAVRAAAESLFEKMGVLEEFARLENGWDTEITQDVDGRISGALRLAISVMSIASSPHSVVMISRTAASRGGLDAMRGLFEWLSDRIVMIFSTTYVRDVPLKGMMVAIADEERLCGIGDEKWYLTASDAPEIREALVLQQSEDWDNQDGDELDDDMDDDDDEM
ncbi:MAG TPA: hypothetical protein VG711_02565 [Phycisphaerales bacterium]|nr:hypothetical protein [Phycisphaerales bacterium]